MFSIKLIIYLNLLSIIIAENVNNNRQLPKLYEDNEIIIDPLELILRSTDTEGIYYCNSRVELNKQGRKLLASFEKPILTSSKLLLQTQQINSTTIRIRIKPNGYIGVNRISCHWDNNITYGQLGDLIIGDNPGVIQLKERCLAYDRRYVECIFHAPNISRAFLNGFPPLYKFFQLNEEPVTYQFPPVLVNITNEGELIFHFEPRDQNIIPKKIFTMVNITLSRFGSSVYRFNIDPVHTTKVNYRLENISHKQLTIRINHNHTGTMNERLCSGHISQINDNKLLTTVQDVTETTNQKIVIKGLHSSTEYEICLRCYYDKTDQSFKEEKCERIITNKNTYGIWIVLVVVVVIALISSILILVIYRKIVCHRNQSESNSSLTKSSDSDIINLAKQMKDLQRSYTRTPTPSHYSRESGTDDRLLESQDVPDNDGYGDVFDAMNELNDENKVTPDTYDVPKQTNA